MFNLRAEQKVFEVGGVKLGGTPGRNPTVLVGTIFHRKHRIVRDQEKGLFDRKGAEELISGQEELSDLTGNPCMLDVEGSTPESLERFIDFASEATDSPILMGGPTVEVRLAGLRRVGESGLSDRIVYNSLMPGCRAEELEMITRAEVKSAVLLAYNVVDMTSHGRVEALTGLLEAAGEYGIDKPLLDTFAMDVPSLGIAFRAIIDVKSELGIPAGCSPHNAVGLWKGLRRKMGSRAVRPVIASVNAFAAAAGADFILYGPIGRASVVFPAVAMVDAAYAFPSIQEGARLSRSHPLFKIA